MAEPSDFEADSDRWQVIGWELQPGDAVFFNMRTVHGSRGVQDDELSAGGPLDHPLFPLLFP